MLLRIHAQVMYLVVHSYRCPVRWIEEYASPKVMSIFSYYYMSSQVLGSDYAITYLYLCAFLSTEFPHTRFNWDVRPMGAKI